MNLSNDGLSLWYGTPDAPAPGDDGVVPRKGASFVLGAHPPSPTNTVVVRYRVDKGIVRTVTGKEVRTDYERQAQYFAVTFPEFVTGEQVEYAPMLSCGGRQAPSPRLASGFPSKFRLAPKEARLTAAPAARPLHLAGQRYLADLSAVAHVSVCFGGTEYVGDTAAGMRVNFFVTEGTVEGKGFKGTVVANSADHMLVRPDGIGLIRIRAAFATSDGATLDVEAGGQVDFGPDGYRRALARDLPDRSPLVVSPLISTRHPRYKWLSRIQCIGVGYTHLDAGQAAYYVHAVSPVGLK